jgi:hypothetical protein
LLNSADFVFWVNSFRGRFRHFCEGRAMQPIERLQSEGCRGIFSRITLVGEKGHR